MLKRIAAYSRLIRFDKPVGTYLVLWPTLTALFIAGNGYPSLSNIVIFSLGCFLMRSAGCAINDFADRDIDGAVGRTKDRPLANGEISPKEALGVFISLSLLAGLLVLFTNKQTIQLSLIAILLASIYPFAKRFTHFPQVILGAAFSFGIPMAFAAENQQVPLGAWLMWLALILWVTVYDTFYAMVDRDDDLEIGVKSTAVLFGHYDKAITFTLQIIVVVLLQYSAYKLDMGFIFYSGITVCFGFFLYHQRLIKDRDKTLCFKAFANNHLALLSLLIATLLETRILA